MTQFDFTPSIGIVRRHAKHLALVVACLLVASRVSAGPLEIHGHVINGTTGEPVRGAKLVIMNPSAGMQAVQEVTVESEDGSFVISELDDTRPIYLLRILHDGVNYTEMIRVGGRSDVHHEVRVFDTVTSWDDVTLSIPHMVLSRSGDSLKVNKFFQITNETSPPRTVFGPNTRFTFYLPGDIMKIDQFYVTSLGIPLPRTPIATEEPGFYTVDYPVKPGVTRVAISFSLPYSTGRYAYVEKLKYPLEDMTIISEDPTFKVESELVTIERTNEQGFLAYRVADLPAGAELTLSISGGSTAGGSARSSPSSSMPTVKIVPSETHLVSLVLLALVTVVLFGVLAAAASRQRDPQIESGVLEARRERLLDQLAKLDDLFATGTVPEEVYKVKRNELANTLAQIYYRLQEDLQPSTPGNKKGSARV